MSQTFVAEQALLNHLYASLSGYVYANPRDFKAHLLNPPYLGDTVLSIKGKDKQSFIGLSYQPLRKINAEETNIEGVIIDILGVDFIKGVESHIDGFKGLRFSRYDKNSSSNPKKTLWTYECSSLEPGADLLEGKISGHKSGNFRIYNNSSMNMLVTLEEYHEQFEKYYDQFIQDSVK